MKNKAAIQKASELGVQAFKRGKRPVPAQDADFMAFLKEQRDAIIAQGMTEQLGWGIKLMKAYSKAWHEANARQAVPA